MIREENQTVTNLRSTETLTSNTEESMKIVEEISYSLDDLLARVRGVELAVEKQDPVNTGEPSLLRMQTLLIRKLQYVNSCITELTDII